MCSEMETQTQCFIIYKVFFKHATKKEKDTFLPLTCSRWAIVREIVRNGEPATDMEYVKSKTTTKTRRHMRKEDTSLTGYLDTLLLC